MFGILKKKKPEGKPTNSQQKTNGGLQRAGSGNSLNQKSWKDSSFSGPVNTFTTPKGGVSAVSSRAKDEGYNTLMQTISEEAPNVSSEPIIDGKDGFFQKQTSREKEEELQTWLELMSKKATTKQKIKLKEDQKVDKEGWLIKEGRLVKSWKKRWFILSGNTLSYYTARRNVMKGSINLESYSVKMATDRPDGRECLELSQSGSSAGLNEPSSPMSNDTGKTEDNDSDDEDGEGRVLYFDVETEKVSKEDVAAARLQWFVALNSKVAFLRYQKKMRQLGQREDPVVIDFFNHPRATVLDMSRRLDQEAILVETIIAIREPIKYHNFLKRLYLKNGKIGDHGLRELCDAISVNSSIEFLDLSHCSLTSKGAQHLTKILQKNQTIKELDLSGNNFDDEAMKEISEALSKNQNAPFYRICLNSNSIGDEGLSYFAEVLSKGCLPHMASIEMKENVIGDNGMSHLASKLLQPNKSNVSTLYFGNNKIGNDGAKHLADSLVKNTNVKHLHLENNEIGYRGTKDLAFMIVKNTGIETLVIGGNRLGEQALYLLANTSMSFPELVLISNN